MPKEKKTTQELEQVIRDREHELKFAQFRVHKDPMGWSATLSAAGDPGETFRFERILTKTVDKFREQFDLKEA
jgi:hypothetical protein